jgi:hypothetical protein
MQNSDGYTPLLTAALIQSAPMVDASLDAMKQVNPV